MSPIENIEVKEMVDGFVENLKLGYVTVCYVLRLAICIATITIFKANHDITGHVIKFIWGIERKTTVLLNNFYYTFIFDWLTLNLVTYNNSKLNYVLNKMTYCHIHIYIYISFSVLLNTNENN